jgi:hypothetical protein
MTLSALGIFSAAGAGGVQGDYELIETQILGSSQASVVFSSLATYSSTYKHLQIRVAARSTRSATTDGIDLRINADTGANYSLHLLQGTGTAVSSYGEANTNLIYCGDIPAASTTANSFGALVIDILDCYSTTKNKTAKALSGYTSLIGLYSGHRRNTESTTSLTVQTRTGSLATGSRFSLYGIRG